MRTFRTLLDLASDWLMGKWSVLIGREKRPRDEMERSDWSIRKLGGWSKPPPQKAVKGLYGRTRDAVIGRIKMTSSNLVYIVE